MITISIMNFFLHRRPADKAYAAIPLGPLYLCAALEEAGRCVQFLDYQHCDADNPYDTQVIASFLSRGRADLVGISCMSNMLPFLIVGLRLFKANNPESFVVVGGSGVSGVAENVLRLVGEIDAIVSGEGEQAIVAIAEAIEGSRPWDSVCNLSWRDPSGAIHTNQVRPRDRKIDHLPRPAHHLIDAGLYLNTPVITARGCPYSCQFCDIAPNWGRRVAHRDLDAVIDEIEWLIQWRGSHTISILDDVFGLSAKRVDEFCRRLAERKVRITWNCMTRADLIGSELMARMHEAGCTRMFLGIESGSDRVRKIAGKGLTIERVEPMIVQAARHFDTRASFILGFPFETLEEFRETLLLMIFASSVGASSQISILSPLPQAELTRRSEYQLDFDRDLVSTMVFPEHREQGSGIVRQVLSDEIAELILSDSCVFSGFYHFREGRVREKIDIARAFGIAV